MQKIPDSFLYIGACLLIIFLLKYIGNNATEEFISFMTFPVTIAAQLYSGTTFNFITDKGFLSEDQFILINRSCSGINFMIITFCVNSYFLGNRGYKILFIPIALLLAYPFTILINSFRVISSIQLLNLQNMISLFSPKQIHEMAGVIIFLTSLILYYLFLTQILKNKLDEKYS